MGLILDRIGSCWLKVGGGLLWVWLVVECLVWVVVGDWMFGGLGECFGCWRNLFVGGGEGFC